MINKIKQECHIRFVIIVLESFSLINVDRANRISPKDLVIYFSFPFVLPNYGHIYYKTIIDIRANFLTFYILDVDVIY